MIMKNNHRQRVLLTETEFEYLQNMLDFGSTIEQALLEIRPELNDEPWHFENLVITVRRTRDVAN